MITKEYEKILWNVKHLLASLNEISKRQDNCDLRKPSRNTGELSRGLKEEQVILQWTRVEEKKATTRNEMRRKMVAL